MAFNAGQQNQQADQTANFFWLIVLIIGSFLVLWWLDKKFVVMPIFWFRYYEIDFLQWLATTVWIPAATFLHLPLPLPDLHALSSLKNFIGTTDPAHATWKNFATINVLIGHWTRYLVMSILLILSAASYFRSGAHFHHTYSMKTLRVVNEEMWPQIRPIADINLMKEDIDEGVWAMARTPLLFCKEHNLLSVTTTAGKKVWVVNQKASYRLISLQVGSLWTGLDALPIHVKAIALIFLARAMSQRPLSNRIIVQLAASASSGQLDFSTISDELKKFYKTPVITFLEKRHAYVLTFMASLLEIARGDGVLGCAEFLWLKAVDRRLWYMLSNVGRPASFVEVAGAYSHWQAEKKIGRALKTPIVKGAVDALTESLQNILYVDEGEQWRTTSAG